MHGGFVTSLASVLPDIGYEVAKVCFTGLPINMHACVLCMPSPLCARPPAMALAHSHPHTRTQALDNAAASPGGAKVYLTGHSLGGAHAMLTALALSDKGAKIGGVWTVSGRTCVCLCVCSCA